MSGKMRRFVQYVLNPYLDAAMCYCDPLPAWIDRDDIRGIWEYVSEYRQQHGDLPTHSDRVVQDIVKTKGVNRGAVNRWMGTCLYEAERPSGEKRSRFFQFIDKEHAE